MNYDSKQSMIQECEHAIVLPCNSNDIISMHWTKFALEIVLLSCKSNDKPTLADTFMNFFWSKFRSKHGKIERGIRFF